MNIPKQQLIDITLLKVDGQNPNAMTDKQLTRLKSSIEKWGFIVPIITNRNLLIADGEQRLNAAKHLKYTQVPVVKLDVEDVDRRLLRQVLNKLRGEHELVADALEFERIIEAGHEDELKHLLDLTDNQLERYLTEIQEPKNEDYEIPEIDKIQTSIKRGDIYTLGNHRLMCGDATASEDVSSLMGGKKADMVFTDPPYGVGYKGGSKPHPKLRHWEAWESLYRESLKNAYIFTKSDAPFYYWLADRWMYEILAIVKECGYTVRQQLIWNKNNAQFGMIGANYKVKHEPCLYMHKTKQKPKWVGPNNEVTVWDIPRSNVNEYHPTQKPVALPKRAILNSSNNPNIVLDLFGGSGSTLIACEETGRHCYMMEIDPRYCQVIVNRWEAYTNKKAEKQNKV